MAVIRTKGGRTRSFGKVMTNHGGIRVLFVIMRCLLFKGAMVTQRRGLRTPQGTPGVKVYRLTGNWIVQGHRFGGTT